MLLGPSGTRTGAEPRVKITPMLSTVGLVPLVGHDAERERLAPLLDGALNSFRIGRPDSKPSAAAEALVGG